MIGRPRKFDCHQALREAMFVFWKHGFHASSLVDLTEAMQLSPPSLYAAFGDKKQLFIRCIDLYDETFGAEPVKQLMCVTDLSEALTSFYRSVANSVAGSNTPPGCLVVSALAEFGQRDSLVTAKLAICKSKVEIAFLRRFELSNGNGEAQSSVCPKMLASVACSLWLGMAMRGRSGESKASLLRFATHAASILTFAQSQSD
jgi:TetR/AcrR family transcriptional regulator, copper-responsive repressor